MTHILSARTVVTAASIGAPAAILWNPHGTNRVRCFKYSWFKTVATLDFLAIARVTARGTASTTTTPSLENSYRRDTSNFSGIVLDTAWSVAPTIAAAATYGNRWVGPAAIGAGFVWPFIGEYIIPPGTGLAIVAAQAVALQPGDVTFEFDD
jgi:hypothetical protein